MGRRRKIEIAVEVAMFMGQTKMLLAESKMSMVASVDLIHKP